jgi:alkaline phosphatase D
MRFFPTLAPLFLLAPLSLAEPELERLSHRPPAESAPELTLNRLTFGSCCKQNNPAPVFDLIAGRKADLYLWLGDNVYADTLNMDKMRKDYATLRNKPGYRKLMQASPIIGVWDDHDFGNNDAGTTYPKKEESKQIFLDWFDIPADANRRSDPGIYAAHELGPADKRVQILLPDLRTWRTNQKSRPKKIYPNMGRYIPDESPKATMLGEDQWKWLEAQLKRPARLRLIGMSTQFAASDNGFETWANYPKEQQRLIDLIKSTKAEGVLFLSGDTHYAELDLLELEGLYPLYDLTASAINQTWDPAGPSTNRLFPAYQFPNYGIVDIDWDKKDPEIRLQIFNADDENEIDYTLPLSRLSFAEKNLKPATPDDTIEGLWDSRMGTMSFAHEEGDKWFAAYDIGRCDLTRKGRIFTGTWIEEERSGKITFTLTRDGKHLQGAYGRGDGGPQLLAWPVWRQ